MPLAPPVPHVTRHFFGQIIRFTIIFITHIFSSIFSDIFRLIFIAFEPLHLSRLSFSSIYFADTHDIATAHTVSQLQQAA